MVQATENDGPGGPPMVRIDGSEVRRIRELNGLTQLYVATVVQVTTDTISRWENRRYPTIKKENAEKLAEALGVSLDDLLEKEGPAGEAVVEPAETSAGERSTARKNGVAVSPRPILRLLGVLVVLLAGVGLAWFIFRGPAAVSLQVSATRILPPHVPPGQSFPVLIRIDAPSEPPFSLIVREELPEGCRLLVADPVPTGNTGGGGEVKWVSRLEKGSRLFSYLLVSPGAAPVGMALSFRGRILVGGRGDEVVAGSDRLEIAPYHWADLNEDYRIDDEEILAVYDRFGEVEGFAGLRDEVDTLWAAGGYRWEPESGKYLPEQGK